MSGTIDTDKGTIEFAKKKRPDPPPSSRGGA
jgi:hypothetical protein